MLQKMNHTILSIPVEILACIFEHCNDFSQVIVLALACKHTYSTYITNLPAIIWGVANSCIRSFDDALMAVRATAIVVEAYKAGTLPPAITMMSLSGKSVLPNVAEFEEVLKMQYLVQCLEYMYFNSKSYGYDEGDPLFERKHGRYSPARRRFKMQQEEEPALGSQKGKLDSFQDSFYRAMYRLLLAGAVLARVYMAPLFRGLEEGGKNAFFMRFGFELGTLFYDETVEGEDSYPTEADFAYLRQFPVYNYDAADWSETGQWRNKEYETCFGEFASWIVRDGRTREEADPQSSEDFEPEWAPKSRADTGAVWELMLLLVAYDHFNIHFENTLHRGSPPYVKKLGNRTVVIIRFGQFQVEQITMPAAVEDLANAKLCANFRPPPGDPAPRDVSCRFDPEKAILELETLRDQVIVYDREYPQPPPTFELWHFALRRYLDLGLKSGIFWMPRSIAALSESIWYEGVGGGEIFLNPNWSAVQKYKPGVASWDPRDPGNN